MFDYNDFENKMSNKYDNSLHTFYIIERSLQNFAVKKGIEPSGSHFSRLLL